MRFLFALLLLILCGCSTAKEKTSNHATREQVIEFLRQEKFINEESRLYSIEWWPDVREWLVGIQYKPADKKDVALKWWTVDAGAKNYSYVCQH